MSDTLLKQFTGAQKGGKYSIVNKEVVETVDGLYDDVDAANLALAEMNKTSGGGRRRRNTKNSWLSHVKATMKMHRGKSFKQVLKLAKKSYKKSQSSSQSHSGGRRRKSKVSKNRRQRGGSSFAENAASYP